MPLRSPVTTAHSVLLHSETSDGSVIPVWEEVRDEDVMVLKDIMAAREANDGVHVSYGLSFLPMVCSTFLIGHP